MEYRQVYADAHVAEVRFNTDVRITGINGWISGGSARESAAAISVWYPMQAPEVNLYKPFTVRGATPAVWQGIGSLKWDVPAGDYFVEFAGVAMPLAYGYYGPVHDVPQPEAFFTRNGSHLEESGFPFGIRIYGRPLSAVPESSTIGLLGGLMLGAMTWWRHRRSSFAVATLFR